MLYSEEDKRIISMLMKATFELRQALSISSHVIYYRQNNFQHYYIGTVLDDMLNIETTMLRWDEFFSDSISEEKQAHPIGVSIIQAISEEIQMYCRKNIEILARLILFQDKNKEEYYKQYILVHEYNLQKRKINDFEAFYSQAPNNEIFMLREIEGILIDSSQDISEGECWFLKQKGRKLAKKNNSYNVNEVNFKETLMQAIPCADKYEKIVLGLSYQSYSNASESIHNSISLNESKREDAEIACRLELLRVAMIVDKCQHILNIYPHKANNDLKEFISNLSGARIWIAPLFEDIYQENDYVFTNDEILGRITEIRISKVGYRSFKVIYLADKNPLYKDYGFYPAHYLRRIHSRKQLEDIVIKNSNETLKIFFTQYASIEEMTNGLDNLIIMWWLNGYKEKVLYNDNTKFSTNTKNMTTNLNKEKIEQIIRDKIDKMSEDKNDDG